VLRNLSSPTVLVVVIALANRIDVVVIASTPVGVELSEPDGY
jgi:hypothetical protein